MKRLTKKSRRPHFELNSKVCAAIYALLCSYSFPGMAAPQGGTVTSGSATISQMGSVTRIDQSTQRASINWQGFGIAAGETVNFNQPNASAITLNRVVGNERSVIEGALNANGKVFLVNSNGVLFTRGSSVNTAGLVERSYRPAESRSVHGCARGSNIAMEAVMQRAASPSEFC